jgi:hypothetical protein
MSLPPLPKELAAFAETQALGRVEDRLPEEIYTHPAPPAQQVAVPMTSQEMSKCWLEADGTRYGYAAFARAIEQHHGIGAKP